MLRPPPIPVLLLALSASLLFADPPAKPDDRPADADGGLARSSPQVKGDPDSAFWIHLTDEQQKTAVESLKTFAQKSADTLKHRLNLHETKLFLVYSDLPIAEMEKCSEPLERAYSKLAERFGIKRGQNIWRGKAVVFIFARIEDYRLYERLIENCDPAGSYAMTHCFGDGMVHIAFYRYPNDADFEHLLVHELVHGFLHRYRSPIRIPSWANEGLADESAAELIANRRRSQFIVALARTELQKHNQSAGDLFTRPSIEGWQYPIAETLTAWMIGQKNGQTYLDFINGIKDGQKWDESLKKNFKMTPEQLLAGYVKSLETKAKPG